MGLYITAVTLGIFGGIAGSLILRLLWPSMATTDDGEPREVRTTNLTLVDAEGRERGVLKLVEGRPILLLTAERMLPSGDRALIPRLAIGILDDDSPGVELADPDGKMRVLLRVTADGTSALELTARNTEARAALSALANGPATVTLADESGRAVFRQPP